MLWIHNQMIGGSSPSSVYAPGQGILTLSTFVSDPGAVNGYLAGIYSYQAVLLALKGGMDRGLALGL